MKIKIFKVLVRCLIAISIAAFVVDVKAQSQPDKKTEVETVKTAKGDLQLLNI